MKRSTIALISIFFILIFFYLTFGYIGIIQSPLSNVDSPCIFTSSVSEIDINMASDYIDADLYSQIVGIRDDLNIHAYGVNGETALSMINKYEQKNAADGWSLYPDGSKSDSGPGWNAYMRVWTRIFKGQIVICADGSRVRSLSGYDVVILTSSAPMSTYASLMD